MIINFRILKTESHNFVTAEEIQKHKQLNINYDINLKNPEIATSQTQTGKRKVLRIEYAFAINYLNPSLGHIRFEGTIDYAGKEEPENLKKAWDSGNAPPEPQNEMANTIVSNIMPMAMLLSKILLLPPALPIPIINYQNPIKPVNEPTSYHG